MDDLHKQLAAIAHHASSLLFEENVGEETIRRAVLYIWTNLPFRQQLQQVSLYLLEQDGLYREIVDVQSGQLLMDVQYLSSHQLPERILKENVPVEMKRGSRYELWLPIYGNQLEGFMIWVSENKIQELDQEVLDVFVEHLAIGFRHYLSMRNVLARLTLLQATTDLSYHIARSDGTEEILLNLVDAGVRTLGFDRATLFLFEQDGVTVHRALFAGIGIPAKQLSHLPIPPTVSDETTELADIRAIWSPLLVNGRRTGGLLLDNLYSHDPIPDGGLRAVMDLGTQVVLALQKAELLAILNTRANLDDLTGLYRVGSFYNEAERLLETALETGQPCGLVMVDLDGFKQVNDTYGHPIGDGALVLTAKLLRKCLVEDAIAGRIGGDEFVVFLPRMSEDECRSFGNQILERFFDTDFTCVGANLGPLTVSVGISLSPKDGRTITELIHVADVAMYHSKRSGKAQVTLSCDIPFAH